MNFKRLLTLLVGMTLACLLLSTNIQAEGYSGSEVQATIIYADQYNSTVTTYRRYHKGFFVDAELFDSKDAVMGVGYQYGDRNTILDLRVNKDNLKVFMMQRF